MKPPKPKVQSRKARGQHIEETALMKALDDDPAAAMMRLSDEADSDWVTGAVVLCAVSGGP